MGRRPAKTDGPLTRPKRHGTGVLAVVAVLVGVALLLSTATLRSKSVPRPRPHAHSTNPSAADLLTGDQATFESSTGGWVGEGATVSWVDDAGTRGGGALKMALAGSPPSNPDQFIAAMSSGAPGSSAGDATLTSALPGLVYEGDALVMPADRGATDQVDAALVFWSSSGDLLLWEPSTANDVTSGSWSTTSSAVAIAPPDTSYVTLAIEEWTSTGSWDLYIDDAMLTSVTDSPTPVVGPLHTIGTQIIEGNGHPVILRGVSYLGLAASSHPSDLRQETFAQLHQWGATMVRFFLNEDLWDPQSCAYDPDYQAAVQEAVGWTTSLGMVALLTLQAGIPQDIDTHGACPSQGGENMADAPGANDFWSSVAAVFKSNPLVAFDLFNEPHDISPQVWLDGGPQDGFKGEGMQELYNAVRKVASNLIFVEGYNWANTPPPPGGLIDGSNVVYDVHYYTCQNGPPPRCSNSSPYDPSPGLDPWVIFQDHEHVPVFLGEFGWPSTLSGTYNANVIAFAQAQGWGWVAYTFDSSTSDDVFDLISLDPSSGPLEPTPAGMPVLEALAAG